MLTMKPGAVATATALTLISVNPLLAGESPSKAITPAVKSVEFMGMEAPDTAEQRARTYTEAKVKIIYANGETKEFPLSYQELHNTASTFAGVTVGDLYDREGKVLLDVKGNPQRSETPDANSLIEVPGAHSGDPNMRRLFLVTHHEYDWLDTADPPKDQYGKQPMTMNLATLDQDMATGTLTTVSVRNIDMANVGGLWIPCAGTLSPWNTHLGSEEYEPDARCAENPTAVCQSTHSAPDKQMTFNDPKFSFNLDSMNRYTLHRHNL